MSVFYRVVSLLGGLALFLYGMHIMGDGLKSSSGGVMKAVLEKVTDKPIKGFLLGLLVTCMIQSSTATIVLTVGLVGAGFLTFYQSIGIVFGANVGTAITAQIIRLMDVQAGAGSILYFFKSDNLAPVALIVGIVLIMFVGKNKRSAGAIGTIFMGFGILFVGLMNMSSAVSQMSEPLSKLLVSFEDNYFLGFLSGTFVTGIIQSSSAVVGILQSIASSVGLRFCAVFAVIIGVNIGDCLTTYLVCRIGAKPEQVRTCVVHIVYNIVAALLIFTTIFITRRTGLLNDSIWEQVLNSGGVANVHGLFRLVPAVILLPFGRLFGKAAMKIVPDHPEMNEDWEIEKNLRELDPLLVSNPRLALAESTHLIRHMSEVAIHNYDAAITQLKSYDPKRDIRITERENLLDRMTDACNQYVVQISPHITLDTDRRLQSFQLKAMSCFERIGDLAVNIAHNVQTLYDEGKTFSDGAMGEIQIAADAVSDILRLASEAYVSGQTMLAKKVEPAEEVIDELVERLRTRHISRMVKGECDIFSGIEFQNILLNMERISDQCSDLALYFLGLEDETIIGREHEYIHMLHHTNNQNYHKEFRNYHERYFSRLENSGTEKNS